MKKIIALTMAALMMIAVFAGCGSEKSESKAASLNEVLTQINKDFPDATKGLTELKEKSDLNRYYSIDESKVDDFAAEINTDSSKASLEIVIVKAKDSDARDEIKEKLTNRYNAILSQYASYSADQLKMAKDCGVTEVGDNYAVLVVAEDYDGITEIINGKLG